MQLEDHVKHVQQEQVHVLLMVLQLVIMDIILILYNVSNV